MTTLAQSVYLDYNATAPVRPEVAARVNEVMAFPANASSAHRFGRQAKKLLEDSRASIAQFVNCWPNEIVFTATGTEANALALHSPRRVLASAVEHSSVLAQLSFPRKRESIDLKGMDSRFHGNDKKNNEDNKIPVTSDGILDLSALEAALKDQPPALVSVMLANNETGVIQPIGEIARICHAHGALLHCDAVQALGKIPVDFTALGADMMSLSAHKFGGPLGAAALVVRNDLPLSPMLRGGGQELGRRAGTENIAAIAGFALACELADFSHMQQLRAWLDELEGQCEAAGGVVYGKAAPRLPNTASLGMPGVSSEVQLMNFDLAGFAVSAGSACSSGRIEPSHVLAAMGVGAENAACAIRVSGGWKNAPGDLARFAAEWQKTWLRLGGSRDNGMLRSGNS